MTLMMTLCQYPFELAQHLDSSVEIAPGIRGLLTECWVGCPFSSTADVPQCRLHAGVPQGPCLTFGSTSLRAKSSRTTASCPLAAATHSGALPVSQAMFGSRSPRAKSSRTTASCPSLAASHSDVGRRCPSCSGRHHLALRVALQLPPYHSMPPNLRRSPFTLDSDQHLDAQVVIAPQPRDALDRSVPSYRGVSGVPPGSAIEGFCKGHKPLVGTSANHKEYMRDLLHTSLMLRSKRPSLERFQDSGMIKSMMVSESSLGRPMRLILLFLLWAIVPTLAVFWAKLRPQICAQEKVL